MTVSLSWLGLNPNPHQFDVAFRSVMQRVTREVRWHLHLKLCPPLRNVAYEQIRTAPKIQTQPLACLQDHRLWSQAESQRHWLITDQRLRNIEVDSNLRSRAPFRINLSAARALSSPATARDTRPLYRPVQPVPPHANRSRCY
jgi:hypothetical protein